jgi:hypothetical protein
MKTKAIWIALCVSLVPAVANAGWKSEYQYCYKSSDGSGACAGNALGWRNSANPNDYFDVYGNTTSYKYFFAYYGNVSYSCTPNATAGAWWPQLQENLGAFYIAWDAAGTCYYVAITGGSGYYNP